MNKARNGLFKNKYFIVFYGEDDDTYIAVLVSTVTLSDANSILISSPNRVLFISYLVTLHEYETPILVLLIHLVLVVSPLFP